LETDAGNTSHFSSGDSVGYDTLIESELKTFRVSEAFWACANGAGISRATSSEILLVMTILRAEKVCRWVSQVACREAARG
jgi:hypothetical protein